MLKNKVPQKNSIGHIDQNNARLEKQMQQARLSFVISEEYGGSTQLFINDLQSQF